MLETIADSVEGREFGSYSSLRRSLGPAGSGMEWHHIVEQTPGNIEQFGPSVIQDPLNVMRLDVPTHRQVSAYYSSIQSFTDGLTVRDWLSTQSFEAQTEFGLSTLQSLGVVLPYGQ
jgi:hypothetical protein